MDPQFLSTIAGAVLSLAFFYIPGLKTWYGGLNSEQKALGMLGLLALVAAVIFGLGCVKVIFYFTCDQAGAVEAVKCFFLAMTANQSTYLVVRKIGQS